MKIEGVKKVLVLGSGGLKIGEAGEFDYSGSQCLNALREEGIQTVLVNPNIATWQTSQKMADKVYFLPVTCEFVTKVIEKERPDAIALSFGGQTALNCGVELFEKGVLERYNVSVLGTPVQTIMCTEDRKAFVEKLSEVGVSYAKSMAASTVNDAVVAADSIGYPVIIRAAYALGGLGSGFCDNEEELREKVAAALALSSQVLVEESLRGWKEVEYEVMRDSFDNSIIVCNMENFDPMGVHTGESIVVAPSQTLSNTEYHMLRSVALKVIRHLGVVGECNIQYALDPKSSEYRVIEVNARLSRSSALASKATGYPIAYVAAKLALGKSIVDLRNMVTGKTSACFEPALDYVVVKYPRWDLKKFKNVSTSIGSSMKSVGEVMAIARNFPEALQKAVRMLGEGHEGIMTDTGDEKVSVFEGLSVPSTRRVFEIAKAFGMGKTVEEIHSLTSIDKWFLNELFRVVLLGKEIEGLNGLDSLDANLFIKAKQLGFSDKQIAEFLSAENAVNELDVRKARVELGILPKVKKIDTVAGEFPAETNYLYLTYNAAFSDEIESFVSSVSATTVGSVDSGGPVDDVAADSVLMLGSGTYRIGSSVEFDWCCVTAVSTIRSIGKKTVMINCNPETVSTDFNMCDKLYFEELSFERVLDVLDIESVSGVVVSMGGQTPNNLAVPLHSYGVPVLGTSALDIDRAENRHKFSSLLDSIRVDQPKWSEFSSVSEAEDFVNLVGFPVVIRPSYVLSGSAMSVAHNWSEFNRFIGSAVKISLEYPVVISKFITEAKEIEMDAVAHSGKVLCYAISEHIENAGVHSGDATLVTPPQKLYVETVRRIKKITRKIAAELKITGPFNIQFIAKDNEIKVIECNVRASRSFPFVSKVYNIPFIEIATKAILGVEQSIVSKNMFDIEYVGVKVPQFSFTRLSGANPQLGIEMASTGEVACLGSTVQKTYLNSLQSAGFKLPAVGSTILLSTGPVKSKAKFLKSVILLRDLGYSFYATRGTAEFLHQNGVQATIVGWPDSDKKPNALECIRSGKVSLVINIPKSLDVNELSNDFVIRRAAVDSKVPLITDVNCAILFVDALKSVHGKELKIKAWKEYVV